MNPDRHIDLPGGAASSTPWHAYTKPCSRKNKPMNQPTPDPGRNNTTRIVQAASIIGAATCARDAGYPAPAPYVESLARFFIDHADNPTAQHMWGEIVGVLLAGGGGSR